jgi:hypothetical protein
MRGTNRRCRKRRGVSGGSVEESVLDCPLRAHLLREGVDRFGFSRLVSSLNSDKAHAPQEADAPGPT